MPYGLSYTRGSVGVRYYHAAAIKLSTAKSEVQRPILVGEYTDYICTEILGIA